jgi:hypothetical protein
MGDNFGLNDRYEVFELWLDTLDATISNDNTSEQSGVNPQNWARFLIGGDGPISNAVAFKVLEAQIPFTYYVFNTLNNHFYMTEVGGTQVSVTIPVGNYTASDMMTSALGLNILPNALNAASIMGNTWTVTYNPHTYKFTFIASTTDYLFTFGVGYGTSQQPNSGNSNPRLYIGFPPGITSSTSKIIEAPNAVALSGPDYLYLNSSKIGPQIHGYLPQGAVNLNGGVSGPQIAKIPVNVNPGETIYWQDPSPMMWFFLDSDVSMTSIDLYLSLGNLGNPNGVRALDLNGRSFSVKIGILREIMNTSSKAPSTLGGGRVTQKMGPKGHRFRPY